ncbi:MAG: GAF domain-containing protein [Pedosphaera sp.]|nr:GAF domain-containing protein [Pedosphaera sp.]
MRLQTRRLPIRLLGLALASGFAIAALAQPATNPPSLPPHHAADVTMVRPPLPRNSILAVCGALLALAVVWIVFLRRQVRQLKQAEAKVRRSEAATRTIDSFATSLLERDNEGEILWDLAKNCVARLGFVDCVVYLLDEERGELHQKAAHGPKNPEGRRLLNPLVIPLGRGIVGTVAQSGRAEIVADTRTDARYIVDDERRFSEITVPIATEGRVLGVIDSEHPQAGYFTPEHLDLLTSIASLCANKLARVRAEARLRELNQELERRITQRTAELVQANEQLRAGIAEQERAEHVQRALFEISEAVPAAADLPSLYARIHAIIGTLMRADNFYLALFDETSGRVSFPYFKDLADPPPAPRQAARGMTEYVLRTGRPTLADLTEIARLKEAGEYVQTGHPSAIWLGVPLTVEGRTFGVMAVQDQNDSEAFGEEDKRILSFVAGQTALALARKRQEEELRASTRLLRESEERFGKAFRSTPAVLSITRLADDRFIEVNEAFLETTGFTRAEVLGRPTTELNLWVDPAERSEFLRLVRTVGIVRSFEARLWTKQRQEETALMSAETVELNGEPCLLALILVITARKRAEEELLRALAQERALSELKSRFVSMVSHEFRTPLGVIMSSAEILQDYVGRLSPERRTAHLQDIFQCTRHMGALMEEVLLLGQVEAGKLQCQPVPLDLAAVSHRIAAEVRAATDACCRVEVHVPSPLPLANGDEGLLRHILTNLLSNAIKYSPAGGAVGLRIEQQGNNAILTVSDHGIGISEADARQLFQAFHRGGNVGQTPGSGLGLVIVKRCVELHRGRIAFDSRDRDGTSFVVVLPVFGDPPAGDNSTAFLHQQTARPNLTLLS